VRIHADNINRFSKRQTQAVPLTDSIKSQTQVLAQDITLPVDDISRQRAKPFFNKVPVITFRNKTNILAFSRNGGYGKFFEIFSSLVFHPFSEWENDSA